MTGGQTRHLSGETAVRTTVIRSGRSWLDLRLHGVWEYRDLIALLVWRDFTAAYKQTILGPLWFIIQPLLSGGIMTVIFGRVAKIPTDGIPPFLFYLLGATVWSYFAACLVKTSETFAANAGVFGKVYFPRIVVPISVVTVHLAQFAIQFGIFLLFYVYFLWNGVPMHPMGAGLLWLPLMLVQMAALGMGAGILVSSMTTKYRDLTYLLGFGVQLWMYATPVVYPASQIPEAYRDIYMLNPMAVVIETFRWGLTGTGSIQGSHMILGAAVTTVVLFAGLILFNRVERSFMDTV